MSVIERMEKQLEEYRARKRREQSLLNDMSQKSQTGILITTPESDKQAKDIPSDTESLLSNASSTIQESSKKNPQRLLRSDVVIYIVYAIFWLTIYIIAIHFEFAAVYFVISLLFFIWKNTRTGPKQENEISAYSVFNPNCEAIDGTLTAEQFEREIRFGPGSVH